MQKVYTATWCDWPGCADDAVKNGAGPWEGQPTKQVQTWFYPPGKGHKPRILVNDLCDDHFDGVMTMRDALKKRGVLLSGEVPE